MRTAVQAKRRATARPKASAGGRASTSARPQAKAAAKAAAKALVRGEAVVEKVLQATLSEVARAGYHGLRIDDVAARAGVHKTTVYRRWPTREALMRDAIRSITAETFTAPGTGSLRGDMLALARRNLELAARPEFQGLFRIFAAGEDLELRSIVHALRDALESVPREIVAAAEARGELARGVDPELLFDAFGSALNWWLFFERTPPDDAFLRRFIDLLLSGARPDDRRDPPARARRAK